MVVKMFCVCWVQPVQKLFINDKLAAHIWQICATGVFQTTIFA